MVNRIRELYGEGKSAKEVGEVISWPWRRVIACMVRHGIARRTRSEASYRKANPAGDPFHIKPELSAEEEQLRALAVGLYWGEGTRRNRLGVRLANSDAELLRAFVLFLRLVCRVRPDKIRAHVIVHSDVDPKDAVRYWGRELNLPLGQFSRTTVLPSRGRGTYKHRSRWGTATVCISNMRLREVFERWLRMYAERYAHVAQLAEHVIGNDEVAGSIPAVGFVDHEGNRLVATMRRNV